MARIQVLPLPAQADGETPYLLLLDDFDEAEFQSFEETRELEKPPGCHGIWAFDLKMTVA